MGNRKYTREARKLQPFMANIAQNVTQIIAEGGGDGSGLANRIYLFKSGLESVDSYEGTDAGLTAALAASGSGDIVWVLAHEISGGPWEVPASVEVVGSGQTRTILTGPVTLNDESGLSNLSVLVNVVDSTDMVYAVQGPASEGELAQIHECHIGCWNTEDEEEGIGAAYGIVKRDGQIYMEGGWLEGGTGPTVTIVEGLSDWREDFGWEAYSGEAIAQNQYFITIQGGSETSLSSIIAATLVYLTDPGGAWPEGVDPVTIYVSADVYAYAYHVYIVEGAPQTTVIRSFGGAAELQSVVLWSEVGWESSGSVSDSLSGSFVFYKSAQNRVEGVTGATISSFGPGAYVMNTLTVTLSLYSPEEMAQLDELAAQTILVYGVRMDEPETPIAAKGDRSSWRVDINPEYHASDIAAGEALYHLPDGAEVDEVPVWDGEKWVPGAGGGGASELDDLTDVDLTTTPPGDGDVLIYDEYDGVWYPGAQTGGADELDDLTDVDLTTTPPADGDVLIYDEYDGVWYPGAQIGGATELDDLTDVDLTTAPPADGDVLIYDEYDGVWYPGAQTGGGTVDASDVTYTPLVDADWDSDTDPGNVDDALNQLAERVDDLEAGGSTTDADAIHVDEASEIYGVTLKETPDDDDVLIIEDSAASYVKKRIKISSIISVGGAFLTASLFPGGFADLVITLVESAIEVP